jgi:hypothetical protein
MRHALLGLRLALACAVLGALAAAQAGADAGAGSAQAAPPSKRELPPELRPEIEATLTPQKGLVTGDAVTLKLRITTKPGVDVAVPEQSFAPLELIDRKAKSETVGQSQRHEFELTLLALEPGTLSFPGVNLRVVGPHGELGDVRTPAETLEVGSLIANEPNAEPKPETQPVVVMQDDYTLAWIAGGLLAAGLIAAGTLLLSRWLKRRPKAPEPPVPPRPAWEVAIEQLLLLEREKQALLADQRGEEFIQRVGDTLREYLGKRYGFDGLESTTHEIARRLESLRPYKLSLSGVSLLLEQCDLVKFARATPDLALCDDLWNGAIGLVRATTPAAPDAPAALQGPAAGDARAS